MGYFKTIELFIAGLLNLCIYKTRLNDDFIGPLKSQKFYKTNDIFFCFVLFNKPTQVQKPSSNAKAMNFNTIVTSGDKLISVKYVRC